MPISFSKKSLCDPQRSPRLISMTLRRAIPNWMIALSLLSSTACEPPAPSPQTDSDATARSTASGPTLSISLDNEESRVSLNEGASVVIGTSAFDVTAIRPWSGLVRTGGGLPMAAVSMQFGDAPWIENVFLADGVWVGVEDTVSLVLHWHDSDANARAAANAPFDPIAGARWGVRDAGRMQWLNTFEPGAGVETQDGAIVTLLSLGREGERPALEVSVRREGNETRRIVTPDPAPNSLILFELPGLREFVVRLHAWRDGAAYVNVHHAGGETPAPSELRDGETWTAESIPFTLRLEQGMKAAAALTAAESAIQEVVLQSSDARIRVREGEAVRYGDALLRFHDPR
jgi:hypothetical protein